MSIACNIILHQHTQGPLTLAETVYIRLSIMTLIIKMNAVCILVMLVEVARSDTKLLRFSMITQVTKQTQDAANYHGKTLGR